MNDRQKERMFRTHIACKIADIEDNHCKSCEFVSTMNKFKLHCMDCKHGQELRRYGDLLSDKSKMQKANKVTKKNKREAKKMTKPLEVKEDYSEINGLTRDKYMMLKEEGLSDAKIIAAYKLNTSKFTTVKGKWGLLGYRVIKENQSEKKVENPADLAQSLKADASPSNLQEQYDKLLADFKQLEANYDEIHTKNIEGAKEYQALLKENRDLKIAFDELCEQKKELTQRLAAEEDNCKYLHSRLEHMKQTRERFFKKYKVTVAALKLHLPEVGETK